MKANIEKRYAIKFCVKLGKSATETMEMLKKAYGSDSMSKTQIFRWHKTFKDGRESVEDEPRSGRPEENVNAVLSVLNRDHRMNVRMIAEEVGISKTIVHEIITEKLHMRKICAKLVPKNLGADQMEHRLLTNQEIHTSLLVREFLNGKSITVLPHPPYSPDLAPCDFFLFPKLKSHLKGKHFRTIENIQKAVTDALNSLTENEFIHCYNEWKNRWERCVRSQGSYFEGDNINL
ncbi:hypothetical protein X777_12493 [Ooceraea biroi]|uniref:Mos1 transposase HTH domain-containing protein n=1 Tax=Ooceraea biroi TaxID=2015173 RepID=A0A026W2H3_OOCBI|nr:hypothetical protein X777_12493 [Ooceraea biroi]